MKVQLNQSIEDSMDINNLMKQAQQMQKKMADVQEKLNSIEVEGVSGLSLIHI